MVNYTLEVTTGAMLNAGSPHPLYVTLIGSERPSERIQLTSLGLGDTSDQESLFIARCLLLLKLEKDPFIESDKGDWFCSTVAVRTPEEDDILFPCHKWMSSGDAVFLRGGRATKVFEDDHPELIEQRIKELTLQRLLYKWDKYADGLPYILNNENPADVPADISLSLLKLSEFARTKQDGLVELIAKGLFNSTERWENFEAMKGVSWFKNSPLIEYVVQHWKNDEFFGYQFLNGVNPHMIKRCSELPSNFPVTEEMVEPFLPNGSSLVTEMENGNIFIADYKIMDKLPTKVIDGNPVALTPAIILLHLNPEKKMLPIAIQLGQQPSEHNPIFLPSDPESDWLLAKVFVRNADFIYHAIISHLLKTHLTGEVFALSTLRNLPRVHPLHKLLMPHHRHNLHINIISRANLYGPGRLFAMSSLESPGMMELMRRALSQLNYSSLCLPEYIAAKGLLSIPGFYYRDDALRLWGIIKSFVKEVVSYYYPTKSQVSADTELQDWVNEIFTYGFLGNNATGIPSSFQTVEQLIQYVTVVIFTSSVQHAVGTMGQFDFLGWIPNAPVVLHHPLPTTKRQSSMEDILASMPNKGQGSQIMLLVEQLGKKYSDFIPLGTYPEQRFTEPAVLRMIKDFKAELSSLSQAITNRNKELELPYTFLNPTNIENSITI